MEEYDDLVQEPDEKGVLDLSHRAWVTIDAEVWDNSATVRTFNLSFNNIRILSKQVGNLQFLEELDLSSNKLEVLPNELCLCRRLRRLRVNGNRLRALPEDIVRCGLLETLNVSENLLSALPGDIDRLATLKVLHAQNNKLTQIPSSLGECLLLEDIQLQNNDITNIPKQVLSDTDLILWQCRHNYVYDNIITELADANHELELLAVASEEHKAGMRNEVKALTRINDELLTGRPETYLRTKKKVKEVASFVCAIQ